jgi:cholesterol oxidase
MADLKGLGLEFEEAMSGWLGIGKEDYVEGRLAGEREKTPLRFDARIIIDDLDRFINLSEHQARLEGSVTFQPLGGTFAMEDGVFNLFSVGVEGIRRMTYAFRFTAGNGKKYFLFGHKNIKHEAGFDLVGDMTTLFTMVYEGTDKTAPIYGAGQIFFYLRDTMALMNSMKVTGAAWWELHRIAQAKLAFLDFAWGKVRQEYLRDVNPLYDTEYENLVLAGRVELNGAAQDFFLVSGIHDRDFPWGDGEIFWDVLLVIGNRATGYQRYAITDRFLEGLKLNVKEGTYRYQGPIYELTQGFATSRSHMQKRHASLAEWKADFKINFTAKAYNITPLPFAIADDVMAKMATNIKWMLRSILPAEHLLGIFISPHTVTVNQGTLTLSRAGQSLAHRIITGETFGEAERSTFRNIKEPTLLYGYLCAIRPAAQAARVQIHANSLRNERQRLIKDQIDAFLGTVVSRVASKEMLMAGGTLSVHDLGPRETPGLGAPLFEKLGEPVLEVNNDHFPTAVFQRRIIEVKDPSGETCLALEEDMDLMRREAENSTKEVTVASIRDPDKIKALDRVLTETKFLDLVTSAWQATGKPKEEFAILIKPNFMFAYNKSDHTTYTDPELVHHLVKVLKDRGGFENLAVVEAQSTYGEYFDKRSVREVAEYLGYSVDGSAGYRMVDLTLDPREERHLGPHLGYHPVPLTWRDADFRISFAKNKTHAYSYYTLTLKNIYGALPLADKFSEYHTGRGIYHTTIEYLQAFPVHFGLIDAHLSADGPFGIFADPEPNITETIIGGPDLVAVDWVGASKMGLDPKISRYMELAVKAFGKPEIKLVGDPNPYRPWLNVPVALSIFTHFGLDANDYFGNLLYMAGAYMDESHFTHKSKSAYMQLARKALNPLQRAIFLQAGGERTLANKLVSKFLTWLGRH